MEQNISRKSLEDKIIEIADYQLDSAMHWAFMNEPSFRSHFIRTVLQEFPKDHPNFSDENLTAAIGNTANHIEFDVSQPVSSSDRAMIGETFDLFRRNNFRSAENYPWVIGKSSNPESKYDWVLYNGDYPLVQYSSRNKTIDICLPLSRDVYNAVCDAIMQSAKKRDGVPILCASENSAKR